MGILIFFWVTLAFFIGEMGSGRRIGRWGGLLACLFFGPLIGALIILLSANVKYYVPCDYCEYPIETDKEGNRAPEYIYCPKCSQDEHGYTREQVVANIRHPNPIKVLLPQTETKNQGSKKAIIYRITLAILIGIVVCIIIVRHFSH